MIWSHNNFSFYKLHFGHAVFTMYHSENLSLIQGGKIAHYPKYFIVPILSFDDFFKNAQVNLSGQ